GAAQQVMQNHQYSLFPNFLSLFYEENQDNSEVIFSYRYDQGSTGLNPRVRTVFMDNGLDPTKALADAFLCKDGLPIDLSPQFEGYNTLESEFVNRDPRMSMTIWEPGSNY